MELNVSLESLNQHIGTLARIGCPGIYPDSGIDRIAFTDAESEACEYIKKQAKEISLITRYDAIGNLFMRTPGNWSKRILIGSHIDSVRQGGNYDGAAGIVTGLEAIKGILESGVKLQKGLELVIWRGEEYTYNAPYKGSAAAFGVSTPYILDNNFEGKTLKQAIIEQGFDPSPIATNTPTLTPDELESIDAHLELHIEQAVELEQKNLDIGIVTSINGDRRFLVAIEGRFDHSGATNLGIEFRQDANLAMAYMQVRLDQLAKTYRDDEIKFVQTVGIINIDRELNKRYRHIYLNSVTKVSGFAYFTLDIMSASNEFMDSYSQEVIKLIEQTAEEFNVRVNITPTDTALALESLDPELQQLMAKTCDRLGFSYQKMASGAGHDTVIVGGHRKSNGNPVPTCLIFIPCRKGISHSRFEYTSSESLHKGALALAHAALLLAKA